jgi:hypothetical protein
MNEEWGTPISKDKIIYRRNKLVELAKVEAKPYTIWHETINENLLDINYMIYEIERLHSIIKEVREYIEEYYESNEEMSFEEQNKLLEILDKESK